MNLHSIKQRPNLLGTLALALIAGCTAPPAAEGQAASLGWLAGHWQSADGDPQIDEIWSDDNGGLMLGTNRTRVGGRAVAFEFLRIEIGTDDARYCAQPGGRGATCFTLTSHTETSARFENPDNDFPQVIEYDRDGDILIARISDLAGENDMTFSWQRATD